MCGYIVLFVLCAAAGNEVFSREITRSKTHNLNFEDGWDWAWGYFDFEDINPEIRSNLTAANSLSVVAVPEIKYTFGSEINQFDSNIFTNTETRIIDPDTTSSTTTHTIVTSTTSETTTTFTSKISVPSTSPSLELKIINPSNTSKTEATTIVAVPEIKYTFGPEMNQSDSNIITNTETRIIDPVTTTPTRIPTNPQKVLENKTIDPPFTPIVTTTTIETTTSFIPKISVPSTSPSLELKMVNPSNTSKTEATSTQVPITIMTTSDISITTKEPILTKTGSDTLGEIRLVNSTEDPKTETTTEPKPTESTTKTPNACDPLPGKPDFSAPGRRINEEQCMGYVWELKNRIKQRKWDRLCTRQLFVNHAVGGRKTEIGEFPHMAAIGWKAAVGTWVFKCGSSLISANFVLTAAHCAKASDKDSSIADPVPKIVRLGDKNIIDRTSIFTFPTDANISNILVHPQYHAPTQYYDIALMELEEPVQFTRFIQPACLWNSFSTGEPDHEATLTGWGVVESGSRDISPELMAATVNVLDSDQCDVLLHDARNRNWKGFQDHQLCAGKLAGGVDSCQGDSGGPLQMKMSLPNEITEKEGNMHYVIGIISFGVGCAHPNLPGVYTRVSSFIDWIEDNVWKNGHNRTYVEPPPSDIIIDDKNFPKLTLLRG
ncbi:serine proteinase stubble-like [Plodia interpunctella]|uniref:serine proteinase stubble-like n=1 Tax=Plodia interpunctella TaxID=58824 RepID=UPI00236874F6|nr:serine proteinase stubble-like [Plodia interpunctella]